MEERSKIIKIGKKRIRFFLKNDIEFPNQYRIYDISVSLRDTFILFFVLRKFIFFIESFYMT